MKMLRANDFTSMRTTSADGRHFAFGMTHESTAAGLRRLADAIEAGNFAVSSVEFNDVAKRDDFNMTTIVLTLEVSEYLGDKNALQPAP